jgi:uroporphyrin-III C-methyltransferase / precorrin-2 dehydrogenase / sirohydrochlorin ferrochelatase
MQSLPIFVRLQGRPVILIGEGEAADAKRRLLERAGALICGEDAAAGLALVVVEDDTEAEAAAARLKARGILVNATDRPSLCDFTLPAIVDRDPVLIAIGTGGASAGMAKALRQWLEGALPTSLGPLAEAMFAARDWIKDRWPDGAARRKAIDRAFSDGGALDLLKPHAHDAVDRWLMADDEAVTDRIERFAIDHDDPDLLTVAQARLLSQADAVYHAPSIAPAILNRARADAKRVEWWSSDDPPPGGLVVVVMKAMR